MAVECNKTLCQGGAVLGRLHARELSITPRQHARSHTGLAHKKMNASDTDEFHGWMDSIARSAPLDQLADVFADLDSLRCSPWYSYLDVLYDVQTLPFPFSLGWLQFFHWDLLPMEMRGQIRLKAHPYWSSIKIPKGQQLLFGDLYSSRPMSSSYYRKQCERGASKLFELPASSQFLCSSR